MTKLTLILDLDGVLITTPTWKSDVLHEDGYSDFGADCVARLNQLLSTVPCEIWLSSTRRQCMTVTRWTETFRVRGVQQGVGGVLPQASGRPSRAEELQAFVASQPSTPYLVIDDDSSILDLPVAIRERCVVTSFARGFDEGALVAALEIVRPQLVDDVWLEQSPVVANCSMNRERRLHGSNGYDHELGFDPVAYLEGRLASHDEVRWLDLCCGSARALFEADGLLVAKPSGQLRIHGVDLVDHFAGRSESPKLSLEVASLRDWEPSVRYDLVTCVHGLHYVGDKLGLLVRIAKWLPDDGLFVGNLDLDNIALPGDRSSRREVPKWMRAHGIEFDPRCRLVSIRGHQTIEPAFRYLGADEHAGPNYTGQAAVDSHYQ